jgi:hypothetical protein
VELRSTEERERRVGLARRARALKGGSKGLAGRCAARGNVTVAVGTDGIIMVDT